MDRKHEQYSGTNVSKPCKKCGGNDRYLNGRCIPCRKEWMRAYGEARYAANPADQKLRSAKWYSKNAERERAKCKEKHLRTKEKRNLVIAKWKANNPAKRNAHEARRRSAKLAASPTWSNLFFIEEIYALGQLRTKLFGFSWHVDHVVPLKSKIVCGLHVEQNLQVVPAVINQSKSNTVWPNQP